MTDTGGYDAVVFDMDGTLVEYTSHDLRRQAAVEAFEHLGVEPTSEELDRIAHESTASARAVCRDRGVDPAGFYERFDPLLAELQHRVLADGGKPPYDDAVTALDALGVGDGGVPAAVLSNNYQSVVERTLDRHLPGRFEVAYGVAPGAAGRERRKPDTGYLERAIAALDVPPERALVVGDGTSDVAVAARAGSDSAHLERRGRHEGAPAPTHRIDTLGALPALVRDT